MPPVSRSNLAQRGRKRTLQFLARSDRFTPEEVADKRTPAQRDRDRILYSGAFSRLAEITQVVSPERGYVFHNRLTHSLKVGQIARRLTEYLIYEHASTVAKLGPLDPDAAEAAGLAHDLGHPPFGHIAEYELNELVRGEGVLDGYEGNAQGFRIVTGLASSDARDRNEGAIAGLNLTRMTLNGVLKYPWGSGDRQQPKKWGYYKTEQEIFTWVRYGMPPRQRSLIAEIMDWADDITFAIHDLLDFYRAGKVPIDRCKRRQDNRERERLIEGMFRRKPEWLPERNKYFDALEAILDSFPFEPEQRYRDTKEDRAKLFDWSTGLIRYFVQSFSLASQGIQTNALAHVAEDARNTAEVLKQFTWEYVIENQDLAVPQSGQREAVRNVFKQLLSASSKKKYYLFPPAHQEAIQHARTKRERVRLVADTVSDMTEREIMHIHRGLHGLAI
ncbi:MAG TPA: dNTP triphosphohydrolase [Bryobacteraceae bacterium]|nr:dNTP triphosphohydrolase [Bryobacteraceae bacterium]